MIQELPVFEAWHDRKNLEIFASLNPKTPCRLFRCADEATPDDCAAYTLHVENQRAKIVYGYAKIYARKLSWLEKLWRKLS